jgi:hypothetical protein
MHIVEIEIIGKSEEVLTTYTNKKNMLQKVTLKEGDFFVPSIGTIGNFLKIKLENVVSNVYSIDASLTGEIKQAFFIFFEFDEKIKPLIYDILRSYQDTILKYFYNKGTYTVEQIISHKKESLYTAIRGHIDYDVITLLASSHYESRSSMGSIIYVKAIREANLEISFKTYVDFTLENIRLVRKILEMSDSELSLVIFKKQIIGLGFKEAISKKILFNGYQRWSFISSNRETLHCNKGSFYFERGFNKFLDDLPKNFILKKYDKQFNDLVTIMSHQKHGALLIITDHAQKEVERLSSLDRGYSLNEVSFLDSSKQELISNLSAVDGAVFIDRKLSCYGTGIILDGIAKRKGSIARGSRYNSSRCYLDNKEPGEYVAIVFSEDETIDVIVNSKTI